MRTQSDQERSIYFSDWPVQGTAIHSKQIKQMLIALTLAVNGAPMLWSKYTCTH